MKYVRADPANLEMRHAADELVRLDLGSRIRELRQQLELTQTALAELCGVRQRQISQYELGQELPRLSTLIRVAQAFDLSVSELLKGLC